MTIALKPEFYMMISKLSDKNITKEELLLIQRKLTETLKLCNIKYTLDK